MTHAKQPRSKKCNQCECSSVRRVIWQIISGEIVLNRRPNGGGVVLLRSIWVATLTFALIFCFRELLHPRSTWNFSTAELKKGLFKTLPWYGAIFAGIYTSLYSRFSSQYAYLSELYNQIMSTQISCGAPSGNQFDLIAAWKAGFIEDAEDLHLATKRVFATAILNMMSDRRVRSMYVTHTHGKRRRFARLKLRIKSAIDARNT